jgi:hypothetical protein
MKHVFFFTIALASNALFSAENVRSIDVFKDGYKKVFVMYQSTGQWHCMEQINSCPKKIKKTIKCVPGSNIVICNSKYSDVVIPVDNLEGPVEIYLNEDDDKSRSVVYKQKR